MIKSFGDKETEKIFNGYKSLKKDQSMQRVTYRKLKMIHSAHNFIDLEIPPSNHLEKLKGNREGWYSIRVNDQYRICFIWRDSDVHEVEITDYH